MWVGVCYGCLLLLLWFAVKEWYNTRVVALVGDHDVSHSVSPMSEGKKKGPINQRKAQRDGEVWWWMGGASGWVDE